MILLLTIPHEQESRFDTDRPYKERNEVNMIHLGDITKIHGNEIEPVDCIQLSLFGRTCPEPFPATTERTSGQCWKNLPALDKQTLLFLDLRGGADGAKPEQSQETDGLWRGDSWTVNISEWPSVESVSLLSSTLEVNAPERYYLSARACQGILTRASKRGKKLPDLLQTALLEMIEWWENGASASVGTQSIEQQNKTGWV